MTFDAFLQLAKEQAKNREFDQAACPNEELIYKLLEATHNQVSDLNLQPTHYFIARDLFPKKKEKLARACLNQKHLLTAPLFIAFTGDRKAASHNLDAVLDEEVLQGTLSEEYEETIRNYVKMNFDQGVFGLTWLSKLLFSPILRLFTPMPLLPAVHKRYWLTKQVALNVTSFLLAAQAAGLATQVIQGYDEWRVKRALGIPWYHIAPFIVGVGYPKGEGRSIVKLPLEEFVHYCNTK